MTEKKGVKRLVNLPEVERLTLTIITDNYFDAIRPDAPIGKRYRGGPGELIHAEHGISFYAETYVNKRSYRLMFDYGPDDYVLMNNMEKLKINVKKIDTFGLSHGHFDHWGGLPGLLKENRDSIKKHTPLYVGHETFARRFSINPKTSEKTDLKQLKRKEIEALGVIDIVEIREPKEAVPGLWLTGDIERTTEYEKGAPSLFIKRKGGLERDLMPGEQALMCHVKGKGLVVISGCAHAGIVNTVRHAQKITGVEKVYAIVGGFHLVNSEKETIERTISDIEAMKPEYVIPTHCTGFEAQVMFSERMGKQFILNTAGTTYTF
ncbi:MAG: MBL fold metallo-hydrolase [Syntrophorhabdaceae bacterium]|nr:MBL fold metallo-hydrolase [Syntrophorhabdaceae bacterium]